ncbi:MAG: tetratricopeptide repeat protein, partial [Desulfarculaceae bacterium]
GAYKLLSAVGYDPAEMVKTFTRLWRTMRYTVSTPPPYLLTHPTSPQRAEALQNLVKRHPVSAKPYSNEEFLRIRTRLVALYDPSDSAETKFLRQAKADPKDPYPLYGLALVKMRLSQFKESLGLLGKLESKWPQNPHIWREQGLCFLNLGDYEKAQTFFNRCLSRRPQDQESLLGLGQSYLRMGRLEAARQTLSQLVQRHPDDDQAQYDLGVTLGRMGKTGEASLHLGLAFKERGNLHMAQYHLDRAKRELAGRPELLKQADKSLENVQKEAERRRKKAREQEDSSRRP